ncbi:MAG: DUF411 domain-containing protein [Thauera sp.]|nr:DUF411 domain-containing protein [Thauera sp.]
MSNSPAPIRGLRRTLGLVASAAIALSSALQPAFAAGDAVTMYKDPNCGCCSKWAEHMRASGFSVKEVPTPQMAAVKGSAGVPQALGSCHTARVGGYVVEGHVPAADVKRLLAERPAVVGIAAPGMPQGSPGMEGPFPPDRYDVVSFDRDGRTEVFARH